MESNVSGLVALFPQTKSEIKLFAENMVESVLNGYNDPLKVKVQIAAMQKTLEEIEKNEEFKAAVMATAMHYQPSELKNLFNSTITIKEAGVKYDYLACKHAEYERICSEIDNLTTRKKSFEKYLQTIQEETLYIDPMTGEEITLIPAPKSSTTTIAITINK